MKNIIPTALAIIKDNLRSRITVFFIFFFPLLLAIIFSLVNVTPQVHIIVYISGKNSTEIAEMLNSSNLFVGIVGGSPSIVSKGQMVMFLNSTSGEIYYNQLDSEYVKVLEAYLTSPSHDFKTVMERTSNTPIAYEISGVIGVVALSNGVFGITGVGSGYYRDKLIERLASSPIKDYEWVISLMIYEVVITIMSSIAVLIFGIIVGFLPILSISFIGVLALATLMFAGLGSIIFGLTPKEKIALSNVVANVVVFPLMFISNAFFSISAFPSFLRPLVEYQPVSIVNDIIRELLLYGTITQPMYLLVIVSLTAVFVLVGSKLLKLRE